MSEDGPQMARGTWYHRGGPRALGDPPMGPHVKNPRFGPSVATNDSHATAREKIVFLRKNLANLHITWISWVLQNVHGFVKGKLPVLLGGGGCPSSIVGREGLGGCTSPRPHPWPPLAMAGYD
jgi:hypothetical protein